MCQLLNFSNATIATMFRSLRPTGDSKSWDCYIRKYELLKDYPKVAVLIPIYRESEKLLYQNADTWTKFVDYPNMQVYWLLHKSDTKTIKLAQRIVPKEIKIIYDNTFPILKGHSLNNAAKQIEEEIVIVFDIDSIPERDYLRRGVYALVTYPEFCCVQGFRLPYNGEQNALTMLQGIEYFYYNHDLKRKIDFTNGWICLLGTGFFIWRKVLKEVDYWGETVTEDINLSFKLHLKNKKIALFEGYQVEEVPTTLWNWLGQRVRWRKGWLYQKQITDFTKVSNKVKSIFLTDLNDWRWVVIDVLQYPLAVYLATLCPPWSLLALFYIVLKLRDDFYAPWRNAKANYEKELKWSVGFYIWLERILFIYIAFKAWLELKLCPMAWYHTRKGGNISPRKAFKKIKEYLKGAILQPGRYIGQKKVDIGL